VKFKHLFEQNFFSTDFLPAPCIIQSETTQAVS